MQMYSRMEMEIHAGDKYASSEEAPPGLNLNLWAANAQVISVEDGSFLEIFNE